jgi:hypothetical protein
VVLALDTPDLNHPGHRRLSVIKNNLAPFPEPLGCRVTEQGEIQFGNRYLFNLAGSFCL